MGLEATCRCRLSEGDFEVKALLESRELILRLGLRRRFAISELSDLQAAGDELRFTGHGELIALSLGAETASRWLKKLLTPPPSLAGKLGVGKETYAILGRSDDGVIEAAIEGVPKAATAAKAETLIAIVEDQAGLEHAIDVLAQTAALWAVHRKGASAMFGERAVREFMRHSGFVDVKVSAVSARYSATKFIRRG